jgi:hypothetical protein
MPVTAPLQAGGIPDDVAARILGWKHSIRNHFQRMSSGLVRDLRIFAASNALAAAIALLLSWRFGARPRLIAISVVLVLALCLATTIYLDRDWFFSILTGSFMGFWYPPLIFFTFLYVHRRIGTGIEACAIIYEKATEPILDAEKTAT